MKYYSTNKQAPLASLEEAVVKGLASDKGLFMPMTIKPLPQEFYDEIENLSFREIAYRVADAFFGEDVPAETLKDFLSIFADRTVQSPSVRCHHCQCDGCG